MFDLTHILTAVSALTVLSLVLSVVGCVIAFRQRGGGSFGDFIRYAFPPEIITTKSCYQDVGFILLKQLIRPWVAAPLLLLTSTQLGLLTYRGLVAAFGPRPQQAMPVAVFGVVLIIALLLQDFLRFYSHYLLHRLSAFWDVHKVHHSAKYLTPLTNHRVHIVEELVQQGATGLAVGPVLALTAYLSSTALSANTLLGFDAYLLIDTLSFAFLRHSHIGLSYGRLERYLMSPKQHHMHHSADVRHWDTNFGFLFAFWDRMAGTFVYSDPTENIRFGISAEESADYGSVLKLHFMPYVKMYQRCVSLFSNGHAISPGPAPDLEPEPMPKV
jgi:sterol desaturase/sphingolipid hydroxylase (fatty acid hydroxylase superfamily)